MILTLFDIIINNINYYKLGPLMFRLLKRARISIGKGIDYIYSFLKGTKVVIKDDDNKSSTTTTRNDKKRPIKMTEDSIV